MPGLAAPAQAEVPAEAFEPRVTVSAPVIDVPIEAGKGILGLVGPGGIIETKIIIASVDSANGFSHSELRTKPITEHGWEMAAGVLSEEEARKLEGITPDKVRVPEIDDGEETRIEFTVEEFDAKRCLGRIATYNGPISGFSWRLAEQMV
jgi:hypothetical protein